MGLSKSFKKIAGKVAAAVNPVALFSTGAQMAGDYMAMRSQESENDAARRQQDLVNQRNYDMQKEFAQHGIKWKVDDAISAGLHPLAALGASGAQASPSFQIGAESAPRSDFYRNMGQNLSRAIASTETTDQRAFRKLQLERMQLENTMLRKDLQGDQVGAPFPADGNSEIGGLSGQTPNAPVQIMPMGRTASPKGKPSQAYGNVTWTTFKKFPDGSLKLMSSPDVQGDKANDVISMLSHHIDLMSGLLTNPRQFEPSYQDNPLPPNMYWKFKYSTRRFHPTPIPAGVDPKLYRSKFYKR